MPAALGASPSSSACEGSGIAATGPCRFGRGVRGVGGCRGSSGCAGYGEGARACGGVLWRQLAPFCQPQYRPRRSERLFLAVGVSLQGGADSQVTAGTGLLPTTAPVCLQLLPSCQPHNRPWLSGLLLSPVGGELQAGAESHVARCCASVTAPPLRLQLWLLNHPQLRPRESTAVAPPLSGHSGALSHVCCAAASVKRHRHSQVRHSSHLLAAIAVLLHHPRCLRVTPGVNVSLQLGCKGPTQERIVGMYRGFLDSEIGNDCWFLQGGWCGLRCQPEPTVFVESRTITKRPVMCCDSSCHLVGQVNTFFAVV